MEVDGDPTAVQEFRLVPARKGKCYKITKIKQDFHLKMIKYRKVFLDVQPSILVNPYLAKTVTATS